MLFLLLSTMGSPPTFSAFDAPKPIAVSAFAETSPSPVPYAVLHAHCSRGGSGVLYVGVPAKDAKGVFSVLTADNPFGLAVGVYDCGPNNSIMKRAVAVAPVPFGQGEKSPTTPTTRAPSAAVRSSSWTASPVTGTSTFIGVQRVTVGGTNKIAGIFYGSYCPSGNCPR